MSSGSLSASNRRLIYFDQAATSFPKPAAVAAAMMACLNEVGASPGRSGHQLSIEAGRIVFNTRESLARLFHMANPMRVVFCLNATEGLNLALKGVLRPGDHAITSGMEHNSVMRPLRELEKNGVEVTVARCSSLGQLDPAEVEKAIRTNTRLVVLNHASNVTGTVMPIREAGRICREKGLLFVVDAAQTGGSVPIDIEADFIDLLAFTGHKGLLGPQGTGGLVLGERVDLRTFKPLKQGGTGSRSEYEIHPDFLPDLCEAGTPNTPGIAGLGAGVDFVLAETVEKIHARQVTLITSLMDRITEIPGLKITGLREPQNMVPTVSFNIEGRAPSEVGLSLDEEYGILCRVGLHCAPAAHRSLGAFPDGTVRFGLGYFTSEEEIDYAASALAEIARRRFIS